MLLIENCFHWIGFHITRHLLEKGYYIDGVDALETEKQEHLALFVGRHSMFRHYLTTRLVSEQQYDVMIRVQDHQLELASDRSTTVKLPFIFGEWMPVANGESETRRSNESLWFPEDLQRAIYVEDLVGSLEQWLQASQLPKVMEVRSAEDPSLEDVQLENYVYIRNNRSALTNVDKVKRHYQRYQLFY